jgi:hypothetical protein
MPNGLPRFQARRRLSPRPVERHLHVRLTLDDLADGIDIMLTRRATGHLQPVAHGRARVSGGVRTTAAIPPPAAVRLQATGASP